MEGRAEYRRLIINLLANFGKSSLAAALRHCTVLCFGHKWPGFPFGFSNCVAFFSALSKIKKKNEKALIPFSGLIGCSLSTTRTTVGDIESDRGGGQQVAGEYR